VSPIQITSAGATGSVVEGGNVVERGNVVEVVDGGGAMVLVVVDITVLEEGCDVDGVDVRLVVATEVADTGDVVEVTGVVGAAVVATTDVVVVDAAGGVPDVSGASDSSWWAHPALAARRTIVSRPGI